MIKAYFYLSPIYNKQNFSLIIQVKVRPGQNGETITDEYQKDETLSPDHPIKEKSSDKENKSESVIKFETQSIDSMDKMSDPIQPEQPVMIANDDLQQDDTSDEGWQEAFPKGRSPSGRKPSSSRRPSLAKLNTNFMNGSQPSRYRGKPTNFASPRTTSNESAASAGPALPVPKTLTKSASFSPKLKNPTMPSAWTEKSANPKSAPASPASTDQVAKPAQVISSISVKAAGKLFSYKEVALAPPGSIVKAVAEQFPKEGSSEQSPQVSEQGSVIEATHEKHLTGVEDGEEAKVQKPTRSDLLLVSDKEMKNTVIKEQETIVEDSFAAESIRKTKNAAVEGRKVEFDTATEVKGISVKGTEADSLAALGTENSDSYMSSNIITFKVEMLGTEVKKCPVTSSDSDSSVILVDNTTLSTDKDASSSKEKKADKEGKLLDVTSVSGKVDHLLADVGKEGNGIANPLPVVTEKQGDADTGREVAKKLSAAAPPFNPSTIPVFGSVSMPGLKDHGGILPPPVNIPPMLTVNPVRRSPHQSATARVPYGPRLSGGYNRSGNRVPRNKPAFHNGEHTVDGSHFIPPIIMNPHATEFVPSQPWVPNGYPVAPNGYLVSPNGYPISPNGIQVSPNGYPVSLNGIPATQNDVPVSPVCPEDSPLVVTGEVGAESQNEVEAEEHIDKSSCDDESINPDAENAQDQSGVGEKTDQSGVETEVGRCEFGEKIAQSGVGEISHSELEELADTGAPFSEISATKENCITVAVEEKPSKRWGDYSDGEAEIVEVTC